MRIEGRELESLVAAIATRVVTNVGVLGSRYWGRRIRKKKLRTGTQQKRNGTHLTRTKELRFDNSTGNSVSAAQRVNV